MTAHLLDAGADHRVPTRLLQRVSSARVWVNLACVVLVGAGVLATGTSRRAVVLTLALVALTAWAAWVLLPRGRTQGIALVVGALAAAVGAGLGATLLIAVVIAAVVAVVGEPGRPAGPVAAFVAALTLALVAAAAVAELTVDGLLSVIGGVAVAVLAAITRRQGRAAAARERLLQLQALETERETERARLLAERSAVARDIHDVLAHSLGGLVLQLDAIDALLEHGHTREAATRVLQAHRLATEGLVEARRAVTALRDPDARPRTPTGLPDLVETHRALGAQAEVTGSLDLEGLDDAHRAALVRALQEALSNARRHAPGATSRIQAARQDGVLALTVSTPLPEVPSPSTGGGNGLAGMRERFAALGDASAVSAGPHGDTFVVDARVVLP